MELVYSPVNERNMHNNSKVHCSPHFPHNPPLKVRPGAGVQLGEQAQHVQCPWLPSVLIPTLSHTFLHFPTPSLRRRALELVYSLVNEHNIRNLTRELLDYLTICDSEFKPDLTAKICMLIQR